VAPSIVAASAIEPGTARKAVRIQNAPNAGRPVAHDEHPPTADIDSHGLNVQVSVTPRAA